MRKTSLLVGTTFFAIAIAATAPAMAQDTPANAADCIDANSDGICDSDQAAVTGTTAERDDPIVVTGSRIRRDEFSTIEPITVVTADEITQGGFNSAADALQSSAVTAGAGQINNFYGGFVTAGGTGANTLGLRNLGPARTLVLLNGRRLAPAGTRGNVLAADLNVLPTAIVDRIEVLKAGASSVYGSDAVAGVVNIITDSRVRGLTIDAQVNVPEVGAGVDQRIAATFGFGNDRLNVIGSIEYRQRNALRLNDRDFTSCPIPGFRLDANSPIGSDDPFPLGDPRNCFTIDNGGVTINTVGFTVLNAAGTARINVPAIGRTSGVVGNFNRFVPVPGSGGPLPGFQGVGTYDRDSFDPASQEEELITPVKTYTGFLAATYDLNMFGDAELYGELLATRRQSSSLLYRQLSLDYLQGSPLLPPEFANGNFAAPTNTTSGQGIAARAFIGFGLTDSVQEVDYVRAGGGLRGDFFFPGWRYDAYVGKSWTDGTYEIESFLIDRIAAATDVVRLPNGTIQCRTQATNPGCVAAPPLNAATIGGNLPQAFRDYILVNTIGTTKFRESTAIFNIDGPLFALPGGDVQLSIGAEYRKQEIDDTPDQNSISGNLLGLTAGTPTRGSDNVKEVFGEVFVPILSDRPFFENVNLNASLRYTDYQSYGSDITYKIAGEWEFFPGIGIRGSYGTSYRAPALAEQFLGATSGFIAAANDPCDSDNFPRQNGLPNPGAYSPAQVQRAANCAAIGIDINTFQQNNGITSFTRGGAETGLSAETSRNWSVGAVVQPRLGGTTTLALALDYFDIKVENGVSALAGTTILNRCYNDIDFDPADGFCRFVSRDANNILTVTSGFVNLSEDVVKGFEFTGRFATDLFGGRFTFNANVTKYTEQSDRTFPEEILLDSNGTLNVPDWVGNAELTYRTGPVQLRYGLEWFDGSSGTAEFNSTSRTTGVVNQANVDILNEQYRIEAPAYFLHSASVQFDVTDRFEMTVGVRNLFDKDPPRLTSYYTLIGNAPLYSGYDYTGRSFFVNTNFKF